jgi:hypothetical protein
LGKSTVILRFIELSIYRFIGLFILSDDYPKSTNQQINKSLNQQIIGGLAQLARAPALHAGGQGFDSLILHNSVL